MKWTSLKWIKLRVLMISCGFVVFLGLILMRSYQLQISENKRVHNLANNQYKARLAVQPKRGAIYDRNGEVLAMDVKVASIAIHPHQIVEKEKIIKVLHEALSVDKSTLRKKIDSKRKFTWIKRRVPEEIGKFIEDIDFKGVTVMTEYRRYYPNESLAGNLLGAVGYDAKALGGLELSLNSYLKSVDDKIVGERDAKGRVYTPLESKSLYHDVYLTLDLNMQHIAEKALWAQAKEYEASSAFAIVLDPKTSEVLAMANYPSFNPNKYWEYPLKKWKNNAVSLAYEPGSTFKSIVAAAALNHDLVHLSDRIFCENGRMKIGSNYINDHEAYGFLTFKDIMRVSSNVGVTKVALKVGEEKFHQMIKEFGFGQKTDIDLPGVARGFLSNHNKWTPIDFSNIAFGQGIAVSGIQMASAYATIANDGIRQRPYVISKIKNKEGETILKKEPEPIGQVLHVNAARDLTSMLASVVSPHGTGRLAKIEGYSVAGKTGTAQKINPETKRYDEHDYIASFVGFAPVEDPELVVYVVVDSPKPVHAGGLVAAPVFKNIVKQSLAYRGVVPQFKNLALKKMPTE